MIAAARLCLSIGAVHACGESKPAAPVPAPAAPVVAPAVAAPAPHAPAKQPPPRVTTVVRVAALQGAPQHLDAPLTVGATLRDGAGVALAAKEMLALDVAQSGRVNVEGPARFQLGTDAAAQVLLASGVISVNVPPAGDGKLIPQRIATPRATFTFRAGSLGVIAVDARGDVLVHVVAGRAEIVPVADGPAAHVDTGAAKRLDAETITDLKPGEDLSSALLKAQAFVRVAEKTSARARAEAASALQRAAVDKLSAAASALATETEQGAQITASHKQAIASGDAAQRSVHQRALAAHGQRLFRLRASVLGLWERLQVATLAIASDDAARATLAAWRDRLDPVLPRE
jgi:hypothetical protein